MTTIPKDRRFSASRVAAQNAGKRFIRAPGKGKCIGGANASLLRNAKPTAGIISTSARRFFSAQNVGRSLERQARQGVSQSVKKGTQTFFAESGKTIHATAGADGTDEATAIGASIKQGVSSSSRIIGNATRPVVQKGQEYVGRFAKKTAVRAGKAIVDKVATQKAIKAAAKSAAAKTVAAEVGKRLTIRTLVSSVIHGATFQGAVASMEAIKATALNPYIGLGVIIALVIVAILGCVIAVVIYASSYAFLINNPLPDTQKSPFVRTIASAAMQSGVESDVLPSVIIAQAMLESAAGTSKLAANANNLFGVKGMYNGQTYFMDTLEYTKDGVPYTVSSGFCKYPSWSESILDHGTLLQKSRYSNVRNEPSYIVATQALYDAGYATDPEYATKLQEIILTYSLTQYDSGWGARNGEKMVTYLASLPTSTGKDILTSASKMLGWPYSQEYASLKTQYTDCSFLVQTAYASIGIVLPRTSSEQAKWCVDNGYEITYVKLQPGDLVFYSLSSTIDFRSITHVAIYCGEGMLLEASSTQNAVVYRPIWGHSQIVCVAHPFTNTNT